MPFEYMSLFLIIFAIGARASAIYFVKYLKALRETGENLEDYRTTVATADAIAMFGLINLVLYLLFEEITLLYLLISIFIGILSGQITFYLLKYLEKKISELKTEPKTS